MRLYLLTSVTLFLCTWVNFSQTVEPAIAVERRMLQLELESLYVMEKEGAENVNSWSIPSVLIRYGLSNTVELQLNIPYLKEIILKHFQILRMIFQIFHF